MKVYIETYGCTANRSDESIVKGIALSKGYELTNDINDADLLVILTCTVISTTEQRMINRIKRLYATGKRLIVSGCMASVQGELVKKIAPRSHLLPPDQIHAIFDIVDGNCRPTKGQPKTLLARCYKGIKAPIAIAEGCIFSCSYCITSKARGRLVSYPPDSIIKTVENALNFGCKEIQLTSQDNASYGLDKGYKLDRLIEEICKLDNEFRIRIGMMNPATTKKRLDEILNAYSYDKVYKFLHLPVQSGDNAILERMRRGYTVEDFLEIVEEFYSSYPDITLSTDIIVGFPGESENSHISTIELLKMVKPDLVNITRFSPRPYTEAKRYSGRVPTDVAKQRSRELTELCRSISEEKNKRRVGSKYRALVVETGKDNSFVCRSDNYKPVIVKQDLTIGSFVDVEVTGYKFSHLVGKLI